MEEYMKEVYERITACEASVKSAHHRVDNIDELTKSVHTIAVETKAMREDVNEIYERLSQLEDKPKKRFDMIVEKLLASLIGILLGMLFGNITGGI